MATDVILYPPFVPPLKVTQWFGEHPEVYAQYGLAGHPGIDISCVVETPIHAGMSGRVGVTQTYASGIQVYITNALGTLIYSHCSSLSGPPHREVCVGEIIGFSGNTGAHTTGPHLEIKWKPRPIQYDNGYKGAVDPWPMLKEGLMELERAGQLATEARWTVEERAVRAKERATELRKEAAEKLAEADQLEQEAWDVMRDLVNPAHGKLYAIEAALGRPVPDEWEG